MGKWERVRGFVGKDPQEVWDGAGNPFSRFSICVESYEEDGRTWYSVLANRDLHEFAMKHVRKGTALVCEGEVERRAYTKKDGKPGLDLKLRASRLSIPGGESLSQPADAPVTNGTPEEAEMAYRQQVARDAKRYPLRWDKPGWQESPAGKRALAAYPALFEKPSEVPVPFDDDAWQNIPPEKAKALTVVLEAVLSGKAVPQQPESRVTLFEEG